MVYVQNHQMRQNMPPILGRQNHQGSESTAISGLQADLDCVKLIKEEVSPFIHRKGCEQILKFLIAGYGGESLPSIALYEQNNPFPLWESKAPAPSWLAFGNHGFFAVSERESDSAVQFFRKRGSGYLPGEIRTITGSLLCHLSYLPKTSC